MILAIPLEGDRFCEHFGRAEQFVMFEIDEEQRTLTEQKRVTAPPHEPGVLPRWLAEQGAQVVIAGGMGPRAQQMLAEQGVRVVLGAACRTPEELTRAFLNGELAGGANSCDHSEHICGH